MFQPELLFDCFGPKFKWPPSKKIQLKLNFWDLCCYLINYHCNANTRRQTSEAISSRFWKKHTQWCFEEEQLRMCLFLQDCTQQQQCSKRFHFNSFSHFAPTLLRFCKEVIIRNKQAGGISNFCPDAEIRNEHEYTWACHIYPVHSFLQKNSSWTIWRNAIQIICLKGFFFFICSSFPFKRVPSFLLAADFQLPAAATTADRALLYLYLSQYFCLYLSLYFCLYLSLYLCLCLCLYLSLCLYLYWYLYLQLAADFQLPAATTTTAAAGALLYQRLIYNPVMRIIRTLSWHMVHGNVYNWNTILPSWEVALVSWNKVSTVMKI